MTGEEHVQLAAGLTITSGNPNDEELAAVTAVISALLEELADAHEPVERVESSAWARSQRPIRSPLRPGPGAWRTFSG